ncbi:hypothetical protein E1267_35715 [Nonomuraea longispora]|uniref:Protein kinase domain-containing protein n=1 Tax=Nonomuraea longispora TaxID=1848320 RepID=A0A4R4MV20_9ACTN|nr:hypothetical protein [Nonomuraea longispora]TDC00071.1 hypothetical protein E1267_35715 [Nonomuraea longispora]
MRADRAFYLASTPAGAHVAVKWLRADQADDERRVQRFLREAQVAKEVAPFCTAVVLDTGVAHDRPYIVSQYVEGPSLEQVVRDEGPLTGAALAATIVFASCGRAPFGHDGHHAVTDRVLNEPPDLGTLDGPLREVAERCLAKDPAERLTAQQVIMRLLRRPQAGADPLREETWEPPEEDAPEPVRPAERTRRPVTGMVAAAVALVLVSGAAGVAVGRAMDEPSPVAARPATPAPSGTPEPVRTEPPGGRMTLYESPSDPIRLTAYEVQDKKADTYVDYARLSLDGTFEKYPGNTKTLVSPDGRYLAERPKLYTDDDYSSVLLTNREAGTSFRVRTVRDVPDVGTPPFDEAQIFSPSGSTFVTDCPSGHDDDHCLWESATGRQVRAFSSGCDTVLGWYDETHLYCWERDNASLIELRVVDFGGKLVDKLVEVPEGAGVIVHYTVNPATTS